MPRDTYVFEVPIYRMATAAWQADAMARVRAWEEAELEAQTRGGPDPSHNDRLRANMWARYVERPYGWQYNEVLAWVRLLWDGPGPVFKGYLWQVGKRTLGGWEPRRRYQRGFHPFPFFGGEPLSKVLEVWVNHNDTDSEIYAQLRDQLVHIVSPTGELPRRYIDLSIFDVVAPLVRWRQLLGLDRH